MLFLFFNITSFTWLLSPSFFSSECYFVYLCSAALYMMLWNSTSFQFSLRIEGTTSKVLQFIMSLMSIYGKNLCLIEQKMYFEQCREVQGRKKSFIWQDFSHENIIWWPFQSCLLYANVSFTHSSAVPLYLCKERILI